MINKGVVKEVEGDLIKVHLYKESACAHCSGCGKKEKMGSTFEFKCTENVKIGNVITFEIEDKSLLNSSVFPSCRFMYSIISIL